MTTQLFFNNLLFKLFKIEQIYTLFCSFTSRLPNPRPAMW